jgi:hypothetical protein
MSTDLESKDIWGEEGDPVNVEIMQMTTEEIRMRTRHIEEEIRCGKVVGRTAAMTPSRVQVHEL